MIETSTQVDLVRYVYNETNEQENETVQQQILFNEELGDEFFELMEMKKSIDEVKFEPSSRCLNSILEFANNYREQPAK
jgi:hypothetical protein